MSDLNRAIAAAGPVVAGLVITWRIRSAVGLRAGEDVVLVRGIAAGGHDVAFFSQRRFLVEVVVAVELGDVFRDDDALDVLPRPAPDAVPGVDGRLPRRGAGAQVGAPDVAAGACGIGQRLAMPVRTRQSTEVGALAPAGAGNEEAHVRRAGRCGKGQAESKRRHRRCREPLVAFHPFLRSVVVSSMPANAGSTDRGKHRQRR
jgi:hypothetical protein